jgi:hypothetical protein
MKFDVDENIGCTQQYGEQGVQGPAGSKIAVVYFSGQVKEVNCITFLMQYVELGDI